MQPAIKYGLLFLFVNLIGLFVFEQFMAPSKKIIASLEGLEQPEMQWDGHEFVLNDEGELAQQGWAINKEQFMHDNISKVGQGIGFLKTFFPNAIFMQTPKHMIIIVVPFALGPVCVNKVIIWDLEQGPEGSTRTQESAPFCPNGYENESLYFAEGAGINLQTDSLAIQVFQKYNQDPTAPRQTLIDVRADAIDLNLQAVTEARDHDSLMWLTPLNEEKTQFFSTVKKVGVLLDDFSYTYGGETFESKLGESFVCVDSAHAQPDYGMNYYFMILQGKLKDGTTYGLIIQDGIGSGYPGKDRATETWITIDGKGYKLDQSKLLWNSEDPMKNRIVDITASKFLHRSCTLTYAPKHRVHDGINAVLLAFDQDLTYGTFSGECKIEGKTLKFEREFGLMETVWTRV